MGHSDRMDTAQALRTQLATTAQRRLAELRMDAPSTEPRTKTVAELDDEDRARYGLAS